MLRRGTVFRRLGHATISITLDTYSHAIPAMQEEALIARLVFAREQRRNKAKLNGVNANVNNIPVDHGEHDPAAVANLPPTS